MQSVLIAWHVIPAKKVSFQNILQILKYSQALKPDLTYEKTVDALKNEQKELINKTKQESGKQKQSWKYQTRYFPITRPLF